jgi:hypothetical protein
MEGDRWSDVPGGETSSLVVETSGLTIPGGEMSSFIVGTSSLAVPRRETSGLAVPEGEMSGLIVEGWLVRRQMILLSQEMKNMFVQVQ